MEHVPFNWEWKPFAAATWHVPLATESGSRLLLWQYQMTVCNNDEQFKLLPCVARPATASDTLPQSVSCYRVVSRYSRRQRPGEKLSVAAVTLHSFVQMNVTFIWTFIWTRLNTVWLFGLVQDEWVCWNQNASRHLYKLCKLLETVTNQSVWTSFFTLTKRVARSRKIVILLCGISSLNSFDRT